MGKITELNAAMVIYLQSFLLSYMKYRTRTDILAQILESAQGGASKTRIMYKTFLSHTQLGEYLDILLKNQLLEYTAARVYKVTPKGQHFISTYNKMADFIPTNQEKEGYRNLPSEVMDVG